VVDERRIKVKIKHTRFVFTVFLAVATLATMGFSAAPKDNGFAAMPDSVTCELAVEELSAVELLDALDAPCYAEMVDQIEIEIDKGFDSTASTEALIESIYARSRPTGSVEYLELLEAETGLVAHSRFSGVPSLTDTDLNEIEIDRGLNSSTSTGTLIESVLVRSRATGPWRVDLLE
jgi:hypothetical protein